MATQGQQGRGKEQGGKSQQTGGQCESDLKEREYRDKEGNIHRHTHTYFGTAQGRRAVERR